MSDLRVLLGLIKEINPEGYENARAFMVLYPLAMAFVIVLIVGLL